MDINKIKKAAEIAKSKTSDKRWIAAIDKAVAGVESGWWIVTELAHGVAVTTECGNTYFANGSCQCKAFTNGQPCKHRALARLVEIASTIEATATAVSCSEDNAASKQDSRAGVIAEIERAWPAFAPGVPLYTELLARFGVSNLKYLADDMLRAVRLAIAM
jgi:hypothetical protein